MKKVFLALASIVAALSVGVPASSAYNPAPDAKPLPNLAAQINNRPNLSDELGSILTQQLLRTVGSAAPHSSASPYTVIGGGGGSGCTAGGNLVDGSPSYMEGYTAITCPPDDWVTATVCLQKWAGYWENEGCAANRGWGFTEAVDAHVCQYTTYEYEYRAQGLVTVSNPYYYDSETATSPIAFAKCWMS